MAELEVKYLHPELVSLQARYEVWASALLDQVCAAGGTEEDAVDVLTRQTPAAFVPLAAYDNAYRLAVEMCDERARAGELIELGDGGYACTEGVDPDAAAHIAEEVLQRFGYLGGAR